MEKNIGITERMILWKKYINLYKLGQMKIKVF